MSARRTRWSTVRSVLTTLIWIVIAVAMVKFAFFPAGTDVNADAQSLDPSADYGQITITPTRGSITNTLTLDGTVQADPVTELKALIRGEVTATPVADGAQVTEGDRILLIQTCEQIPDPVQAARLAQPDAEYEETRMIDRCTDSQWVTAPITGTLHLTSLKGQMVEVGTVVGTVQPPTFRAVATLTPDQMYRINEVPGSAQIAIKNGPAPFECGSLAIDTPTATASTDKTTGVGTESTGTTIQARCSIPADQRVFPGLQVTMTVVGGEVTDVLTLPVTAVEGRFQTGHVYAPSGDPKNPERIDVGLGLTDGTTIEITSGLEETDEVLEFLPGQEETAMTCDPVTGEGC